MCSHKSYYHHFIAINFTKPSWRTLRNMIFSVTNPTDFVDWLQAIHKMWLCSFWTLPHRGLSLKDLPPRNTPDSFCRLLHPTKSIAALLWRYFSLWETYLENFMSRPNVIPAFQSTPLHKQGQELRSEQTVTHIHEQWNSLLIFAS